MSRWRRQLRRTRRVLAYSLAGAVIVAGLAVAVLGQVLPWLGRHPQQVATWLSEQAGRPIALTAVQAAWTRQGPQLQLQGLRIGDGAAPLELGSAELQLDVYAGLFPGRPFSTLQLTGLSLELERAGDGRWQLRGLAGGGGSLEAVLGQLDAVGELYLHRASLRVVDARRGIDAALPRIDARLRGRGNELRLGVLAHANERTPLRAVVAFDQNGGHGRGWLRGDGLQLADWRTALQLPAAPIADGRLAGQLWVDFTIDGPTAARFELVAEQVRLTEPAMPAVAAAEQADVAEPGAPVAPVETDELARLELHGDWQSQIDGWRLQVSTAADGDGSAAVPYLALHRRGPGWSLAAAGWPLAPLSRLLAHAESLPPGLAEWLRAADPHGVLAGVEADLVDGALRRAEGRIDEFGFAAVGTRPGVAGLDLAFFGDADGFDVELAGAPLRIDWPPALLRPFEPQMRGAMRAWRGDDGIWALELDSLRLREPDYDVTAGGSLRFDGGRPSASLRAAVGPGPVTAAKRFWIRHTMPPGTVEWLDEAIEDGRIERGHALIEGDLDDWPFEGREGRFDAEAQISDVRLRFRPDWPAAEQVAGIARFIDDGMLIEASGRLRGMEAPRAVATIAEFDAPVLGLDIEAHGTGPAMLDVLRHSQLQSTHGEHFDALTIGGRGEARVAIALPLNANAHAAAELDGSVRLRDAELADDRWGIGFGKADGTIRFSDRGLATEGMAVQFDDQPGSFDLAIGSFTADPAHAVEARLLGRFEPASLIATRPAIDWLKPYLRGASRWQLELGVPQPGRGTPRLSVRSDLVGTRLALPAPLAKSPAVKLPLRLAFDLPADDAASTPGRLDLELGELLRLYGELGERGFDGVAAFGETPAAERPARGLRVVGQVPVLDLGGWAGLALASDTGGDGLLADLDLDAGQIDLLDRSFTETSLHFQRRPDGGSRLAIDGSAVQGEIELPPDDARATRGITGRFERLHWPEARSDAPALAVGDPASLPPLHVWIGDLRIADATLGDARLEAFPTERGLRIERFETRSPALELFARGDWTRDGLRQRSDFSLEFTAPDLGRMLRALGFEALIERGETLARLQVGWPGSPGAFSLDAVDGWLEASVGKGRIPEVEPGGVGRVFGLLSLSEIPRRLALDFSDFFGSGLAFNRIEGRFVFDDGQAITDDLLIDGPAAEIRIRGRTGLKAQVYDQTMEVLPRAGNVLPIVGALAGGPAGAAIGAVAQAVLARPFKQMTRTLYRVEGDWKDPRIEVLERGPARPVNDEPAGLAERD